MKIEKVIYPKILIQYIVFIMKKGRIEKGSYKEIK